MELIQTEAQIKAQAKKDKVKKDKVKKDKIAKTHTSPPVSTSVSTSFDYNQETAYGLAESLKMQVKVDRSYVWVDCTLEQFQALKQSESDLAQFKFLFSFAGKRKQWMFRPLVESDIEARKAWFIWENGVPVKLIGKAKAKAKAKATPTPTPEQDNINERLDKMEALLLRVLGDK